MALNSDNVRVGLNGNIYMAPKGSTAPTDLTTAWDAAWLDLGYMSEDGVSLDLKTDVQDIKAWQSLSPVRRVLTSLDLTMQFTAIELKTPTVTAFFPGATMTDVSGTVHQLSIPAAPGPQEYAFGMEWVDGTITNRLIIPRGEITDRGTISVHRSDAVALQMTVSAYATSAPEIATWLSNDPAWSAA